MINSNFSSDYDTHTLFFGNYSCGLECTRPIKPLQHVTYYGTWWGNAYYNMTTSSWRTHIL